eukprot:12355436-Alexandrium_andersonii.AAC.1
MLRSSPKLWPRSLAVDGSTEANSMGAKIGLRVDIAAKRPERSLPPRPRAMERAGARSKTAPFLEPKWLRNQ